MTIGFVASAYFTLLLVVVHYAMGYHSQRFPNPIDEGLLRFLRSKLHVNPSRKWEPVIRNAVLMLSDQQLVTGIALLTAGYSQLSHGISFYHWGIVVNLTWFSCMTHLTTLTTLRYYFQNNPTLRTWRACLMLIIVIMLGVALLPNGDPRDQELPALCGFRDLYYPETFLSSANKTVYMVLSIVLLFFGYMTRLIKLSPRSTAFTKRWLRQKPGSVLRRGLDKNLYHSELPTSSRYWIHQLWVFESLYISLRAVFDIFESMIWEVRHRVLQ